MRGQPRVHTRRISTGGKDPFLLSRIDHQRKKLSTDMKRANECIARASCLHVSKGQQLRWGFFT